MEYIDWFEGKKDKPCQETIDTGARVLTECLKKLDKELEGRDFLVTDQFTFADV